MSKGGWEREREKYSERKWKGETNYKIYVLQADEKTSRSFLEETVWITSAVARKTGVKRALWVQQCKKLRRVVSSNIFSNIDDVPLRINNFTSSQF